MAGELGSTFPSMTFRIHHQRDRQESGLPQRIRLLKCITGHCGARFVNANSRRSRTLRRMLNKAGHRVAVVGFPVTHSTRANQRRHDQVLRRARNRHQGRPHLLYPRLFFKSCGASSAIT